MSINWNNNSEIPEGRSSPVSNVSDEDTPYGKPRNSFDADAASEDSSNNQEYVAGTFEGPEKTMEVMFAVNIGVEDGLRALTRNQLDLLCKKAKCTILSKISSSYMDAYVLSESSMFVYKHRFIMKTCGTTTLLRCLGSLLEFADELGMELLWVGYNRKNLMFPGAQLWPHSNFGEEINYLSTHAKLQNRLHGSGYILGPVTGDHWFVYVADHSQVKRSLTSSLSVGNLNVIANDMSPKCPPPVDRTINLMMFDMAADVAEIFFKRSGLTAKEMTLKAGIDHLCPGAQIDETSFTPCGYSMNAILHDAYSTIHITPEPECSYCSFETNTSLKDYSAMVRNVLSVFRPKRFVLTMFGDEEVIKGMKELPTDPKHIIVPGWKVYSQTSVSSTKVENDLVCLMGCFSMNDDTLSTVNMKSIKTRDRGYSLY